MLLIEYFTYLPTRFVSLDIGMSCVVQLLNLPFMQSLVLAWEAHMSFVPPIVARSLKHFLPHIGICMNWVKLPKAPR